MIAPFSKVAEFQVEFKWSFILEFWDASKWCRYLARAGTCWSWLQLESTNQQSLRLHRYLRWVVQLSFRKPSFKLPSFAFLLDPLLPSSFLSLSAQFLPPQISIMDLKVPVLSTLFIHGLQADTTWRFQASGLSKWVSNEVWFKKIEHNWWSTPAGVWDNWAFPKIKQPWRGKVFEAGGGTAFRSVCGGSTSSTLLALEIEQFHQNHQESPMLHIMAIVYEHRSYLFHDWFLTQDQSLSLFNFNAGTCIHCTITTSGREMCGTISLKAHCPSTDGNLLHSHSIYIHESTKNEEISENSNNLQALYAYFIRLSGYHYKWMECS